MGKDWWDWRSDWSSRKEPVFTTDKQRMDAIVELASRCILLEDLPDDVTARTIDTSLDQFGTVLGVKLVKSPVDQKFMGRAFVEVDSAEKKSQIMKQLEKLFFMPGAMPRPLWVVEVTPALMIDHPWRRNPNIAVPRVFPKTDENNPLFLCLTEKERNALQRLSDEKVQHRDLRQHELLRVQAQERELAETKGKLEMIAAELRNGTIAEMRKLHGLEEGPQEYDY